MRLPPPVAGDGLRKNTQLRFDGFSALGSEGRVCSMENMSTDYWPEMASRPRRKKVADVTAPGGMSAWTELIWADGADLHVGQTTVTGFLTAGVHHSFSVLGDYLTIWPDKLWYDLKSGEHGSLEASVTIPAGFTQFLNREAPAGISDECNTLASVHPTITDFSRWFKEGDAVEISGCVTHPENNKTAILRENPEHNRSWLFFLDGTWTLDEERRYYASDGALEAGVHYFVVSYMKRTDGSSYPLFDAFETTMEIPQYGYAVYDGGAEVRTYDQYGLLLETVPCYGGGMGQRSVSPDVEFAAVPLDYTEAGAVTIARRVPDMDFVFCHENRLWGCRGDTIYCSKLGDIYNWNVFDGIASDSWSVETGTPGDFTAAASYGGCARFFKEHAIITVYGDYPGEYALQTQEQLGVAAGSGRSLAAINAHLFYLSPLGPCAYGGSSPQLIAEDFGVTRYRNGIGGTDGRKWFLRMTDEHGAGHLFVFDTGRNMWVREDALDVIDFAWCSGDIYAQTADAIWILGRPLNAPADAVEEEPVKWWAEFGDIASRSPNKKRVTKVQLRLEMEDKCAARVWMKYDSEADWRKAAELTARRKRSAVIPVIPRRLDHFQLRIEGQGDCRISSLAIESAGGSDRR
jgi:hypothetical protein